MPRQKSPKYQIAAVDGIHYLVQGDGQASRPAMLKSWFKNDGAWAAEGTGASTVDTLREAKPKKSCFETSYRLVLES